jgi:hypothetical protein
MARKNNSYMWMLHTIVALVAGIYITFLHQSRSGGGTAATLPVCLVVIDYRSPASFRATVRSLNSSGLLSMVSERILFAQQIQQYDRASLELAAEMGFDRVVASLRNLYIHGALAMSVEACKSDYVLLLEKDFQLVESREVTRSEMEKSIAVLESGCEQVKVVRMKSRRKPGVPEFARMSYQHHEQDILTATGYDRDLICQLVYWKNDTYIEENVSSRDMWPCTADPSFWCATAAACHWTNQAPLFRRDWFMKHMHPAIKRLVPADDTHYQQHHALEISCRYDWECKWPSTGWAVALGRGLFSHRDMEKYGYDWDAEELNKF